MLVFWTRVRDAIREVYRKSGAELPAWLGEIVP
jgi:hypothetical protein